MLCCDSLYATAADANGAYFGGHERFSMNTNGCDGLGPDAYNAPGRDGLDPANGNLYVNADNSAGYNSRDRGLGAVDMLVTSAGLWIARTTPGPRRPPSGADAAPVFRQVVSILAPLALTTYQSAPNALDPSPCATPVLASPTK
jgi:hypothetical protein